MPGVTGAELMSRFPPRPLIVSWSATEAGRPEVLGRVLTPPYALDQVGSHRLGPGGLRSIKGPLLREPTRLLDEGFVTDSPFGRVSDTSCVPYFHVSLAQRKEDP